MYTLEAYNHKGSFVIYDNYTDGELPNVVEDIEHYFQYDWDEISKYTFIVYDSDCDPMFKDENVVRTIHGSDIVENVWIN